MHTQIQAEATKFSCDHRYMHMEHVHKYDYVDIWLHQHEYDYSSLGRTGSTSTLPCAASTRLPAAAAIHRLRRTLPRCRLLTYDYFDYSSRLVNLSRAATMSSTTSRIHLQLVDFSSNRRGFITDRHGFVDTRPRIKLSHLFQ
jgi:hypothetical protein